MLERPTAKSDEPWLYVVALRVMRLPRPVIIPDSPAYAGCRSWIPLENTVDLAGSTPVISTGRFEIRLDRINSVLNPGRPISRSMNSPRSSRTT